MEGERPFIDGEWRAVQEDHGVIIGQPSMEAMSEDFGVKGGGCQIGDSTANVGDLVEMESQSHLDLRATGEMDKVGIGNVRTRGGCGQHFRKSDLSEWRSREIWLGDMKW